MDRLAVTSLTLEFLWRILTDSDTSENEFDTMGNENWKSCHSTRPNDNIFDFCVDATAPHAWCKAPTLMTMDLCEFIVLVSAWIWVREKSWKQILQIRTQYETKICIHTSINSFVNITNQRFGMNSYSCWSALTSTWSCVVYVRLLRSPLNIT